MQIRLFSAGELDDLAGRPDVVLVDVRSRREYARSHIRSAVNMPWKRGFRRTDCRRENWRYVIVNTAPPA